MSAILGYIDFKKNLPIDSLKSLSKQIYHKEFYEESIHKKTDYAHIFFSCGSKFSKKKQIVSFHHLTLVMDGNIYNKEQMIIELHKYGYKINSYEDAEIFITAFAHFGPKINEKIDGVFSCMIYDSEKEKVFLLRDNLGLKPLYYYQKNGFFLFGSSLKYFYQFNNFEKKIDKNSLAMYFRYGYILQPYSIFQDCYKLQSGHYLEVELKTEKITEFKHWDIVEYCNEPKHMLSETDIIDETQKLLIAAIQKRVNKTRHIGAFLSGGYDSSTITAILQAHCTQQIKTFTIGFEDHTLNEAPYAKEIAKYLETDHTEYYFTEKDAFDIVPKLSDYYDEPFADNGAIPTILLANLAKTAKIDTLFGGDGGDQVFATAIYKELYQVINFVPKSIRKIVSSFLYKINPKYIPYLQNSYNFPIKYHKCTKMIDASSIQEMIETKLSVFLNSDIKKLLQLEHIDHDHLFSNETYGKHSETLDQIMSTYLKIMTLNLELVKTNNPLHHLRISREMPYFDKELLHFVTKIPANLKIKNGVRKYILKQVAHQYIPKKLLNRPKSNFSVPRVQWLKGKFKEPLMDITTKKLIDKGGLFNYEMISKFQQAFFNGKEEYGHQLWFIFIFQLWYENMENHHFGDEDTLPIL